MTALELMSRLRALQVELRADHGRLKYTAEKGVVTPALLAQLTEHKTEILYILARASVDGVRAAPPLVPQPRRGRIPLSFAQQRMWFLDQLIPGSALYNVPCAFRLAFAVDVPQMARALTEIIRRHEALRTTFVQVNGLPSQKIAPELNIDLPVTDLRPMTRERREAEARRLATEQARQPFDLSAGPLIRASMLRVDDQEYVLLLCMHHIVADGWSMQVFIRELSALYTAFAAGRPSPLPELPIQYADFAIWQREWLQGEVLDQHLRYWRQQLAGLPLLSLSTDRPRPLILSYSGARQFIFFPTELRAAVQNLADSEGVTLFMVLAAGFAVLLQRYTGQDDIVLGTPIANRDRPEIEGLIGFFVNSLVLRIALSGDPTVRELLRRVKDTALAAYAHQNLPFEKLVEELHPDRDLNRNPLFQVMFQLQSDPVPAGYSNAAAPPTNSEARPPLVTAEKGTTQFDLSMDLWVGPGGLDGQIEYSTELFDGDTIQRFGTHYQNLLESAAANPDRRISELRLLSDTERSRMLTEWNQTGSGYPQGASWATLFEEKASTEPDAAALICGDLVLSYSELNRRANTLARLLRSRGVRPNTPVGILMERSPEAAIALLAVLKAGGAYVPLDPAYPVERMRLVLTETQPRLVLTQRQWVAGCPGEWTSILCVDEDCSGGPAQAAEGNQPTGATGDDLAYIVYTSGSSGSPKGVEIRHRALVNHSRAMMRTYGLRGTDRVLQFASLSFDVSAEEMFPTWASGAAVVIHPGPLALPIADFLGLVERLGITVLNLPAPYWHEWARELERRSLRRPSALRLVVTGSQRVLPECTAAWQRHCDIPLINAYGVTEAAITALTYTLPQVPSGAVPDEAPIGRPIANMRAYILDGRLEPVALGAPGELYLAGDGLARGYVGQPELTAERFIPDPFTDRAGVRMYRTGDRARYRADGNIVFLGRMDEQLKVHGYRIEPGEVEAVLARHASVKEVVVTARADAAEDPRLVACVVPTYPEFSTIAADKRTGDQVAEWKALYDGLYERSAAASDPRFNTYGWNITATGKPIPESEMREWLDNTVSRIMCLQPSRVLEIGCGLGLILFAVAPHVAVYAATDFSPIAIEYLRRELKRSPIPQVQLHECAANEFGLLGPELFDTIVINSVIQYFPSVEYLINVLRSAVRRLAPRGSIFIGDVRSLPLLHAFDASLELQRAPARLSTAELRKRVQKQILQEQELILDPRFFYALKQLLPEIGSVEISIKSGRSLNELIGFRYDVVLRTERAPANIPDLEVRDWHEGALTMSSLRRHLDEAENAAVLVRSVPNTLVAFETALVGLLAAGDQAPPTVELLRRALRSVPLAGEHPADFWELAENSDRQARIFWTDGRNDGSFDVLFAPRAAQCPVAPEPVVDENIHAYANTPLLGAYTRRLTPELRAFAKGNLPEYMVPSTFVLLGSLPLLPNGKLDHSALPSPETARPEATGVLVLPRSETEAIVARVWAELLGLERVGVNDNFFDLGGHSLVATQLISRLRDRFEVELPLQSLFEGPTVAQLAQAIEEAVQAEIETLSEEDARELLGEN